eukprot:GAHX01006593.1.p2 GENE.GAHX01006593.1~~GAHX01006593.1.p2  ORF type:complete len:54 (-),score=1.97 GAHX01006593.1:349-510(-)
MKCFLCNTNIYMQTGNGRTKTNLITFHSRVEKPKFNSVTKFSCIFSNEYKSNS